MPHTEEWINITDASRRYSRTRHSVARLIERAGIESQRSGRSRLVRAAEIERALSVESLLKETDASRLIDEVLAVVYSYHHRLSSSLFPGAQRPKDAEDLRKGRLGRDLRRFVELATGARKDSRDDVNERIDSVFQLLFWAPMAEDYQVPRSFWETDLGHMISMAKYRAFDASELISVGQAAMMLGVTRPTVFRWMDEKHLDYVRDDVSGRTFVVLEDVEAILELVTSHDSEKGEQQDRGPPAQSTEKQSMGQHRLLSPQPLRQSMVVPPRVDAYYSIRSNLTTRLGGPTSMRGA